MVIIGQKPKGARMAEKMYIVRMKSSSGRDCYISSTGGRIATTTPHTIGVLHFGSVEEAERALEAQKEIFRWKAPEQLGCSIEYIEGCLLRLKGAQIVCIEL
jgi:hypothetical protein